MSENWKTYKLSDFININPLVKLKSNEPYSFVEMKDLHANLRTVKPSDFRLLRGGARFQNGDTLFARITPCLQNGKICQVRDLKNSVGFGSTEFLVFRGKEGVSDTDFVYYLSREPFVRQFAETNMIGTSGRQRVAKEAFQNIQLELPSLQEQLAIASILSALDDKIELNLQMNKTLEEMAMALYKHWFVDFGPFQNGKFVESELGMIPEEWEVVSIYNLVDVIYGAPFKSKLFNEDKKGYPLIRIRDLKLGNPQYYTEENHVNKTIIKKGDILAGMDALFVPYAWSGNEGVMNQRVVFFKPKIETVKRRYIYEAAKPWLKFYEGAKVGTTVIHLSKSDIDNFKFIYPQNHHILTPFNNEIDAFHDLIISNDTEIATLTTLRDTLLPKLISGQIRVKDAEQMEAASL